jgi:probable HAF family extracellular repeat protein
LQREAGIGEGGQTMNSRTRFLIRLGWIVFALVSLASAQSYKVIPMGSLGGRSTVPAGINGTGQVTGTAYVHNSGQGRHTHAFLWTNGKGMKDLGTLGGMDSQGFAVNNLGQVVGLSWLPGDTKRHAFLWTQSGGMQDLGTLGGDESVATAINRSGQVVGWSVNANKEMDAFFWTKNGGMQDLGNLGFGEASATGITDDGAVVGWSLTATDTQNHIFLWTAHGGMRDLGKLGGNAATPDAINNQRTIVGSFLPSKGMQLPHAFVLIPGMAVQDLGEGEAKAVNGSGSVVGITTLDDQGNSAFLWTESGGMQDLGKLIPPHQGIVLLDARAINANGKIAAIEVTGRKTLSVLLVPLARR